MEAANRGARDAGGRTIGLNIGLPHEQRPNPYITPGLGFEFHYFFMRKLWFAHLARALVVFPGGFGTLDELSEMLTLAQTRKLARDIPILLYGSSYWNEVINFEAMVRHGMIDRERPRAVLVRRRPRRPPSPCCRRSCPPSPSRPRPRSRSRARRPRDARAPARDRRSSSSAPRRPSPGRSTSCARPARPCCSTAASFRAGAASRSSRTATSRSTRRTLDAVVLSHAHIDHSGALPLLVPERLRGADVRDARDARSRGADAARRGDDSGGRRAPHRAPDRAGRARTSSPVEPLYGEADVATVLGADGRVCPTTAGRRSRRASR